MKFITYVLAVLVAPLYARDHQWQLSSPDKVLSVTIFDRGGQLLYSISHGTEPILEDSPLGVERSDGIFWRRLKFVDSKTSRWTDEFQLYHGKKSHVSATANQLTLRFKNENNRLIELIFRAFHDGVAFQYHFPETSSYEVTMNRELSGFVLPAGSKAFIQPYDLNVRNKPCYETYYENGVDAGMPSPQPVGWAFPALFRIENHWALITEAALNPTYCATHLQNTGRAYSIRFPEKEEVTSTADPEPRSILPWTTPWRVIIIGTLDEVVSSSLVQALNPPTPLSDVSWIRPGRASWSWWSNGATTRSFDVQKEYVDFNSSMGWEYILIDAGWPEMTGGSMEDLVKYATSKGVGVFLWYHSGMGREKDTLSMANMFAFHESRKSELQKIRQWGVKGIKVDFFDSDKQPVIKRYFDILTDAADQQIMVNFHGSTLPRGWERTYPHVMSMESVKGAEGYGRQEFCDRAPEHNTILPFTRNVVGSMDYTPVTFTFKREAIRRTTFGHELALSIVFESGVFHFADRLNAYRLLPAAPKEFLQQVPVAWDESHVVAGSPGEFVVIARRHGSQWYVGGINGLRNSVDIAFTLPDASLQTMSFITDGEETGDFTSFTQSATSGRYSIRLKPYGGFVAVTR